MYFVSKAFSRFLYNRYPAWDFFLFSGHSNCPATQQPQNVCELKAVVRLEQSAHCPSNQENSGKMKKSLNSQGKVREFAV